MSRTRHFLHGFLAMLIAGTVFISVVDVSAAPKSKYDHWLNSVVVVRSSIGEGTGFFITADGLLVTNHHVVGGDNRVYIGLRQGGSTTGTVVALDEDLDLALVSVPVESPDFLELARPNEGGVGADVIAIGTARGLSWSVSRGIVSGLRGVAPISILVTVETSS
jgi:S1-C subfamily serine protease